MSKTFSDGYDDPEWNALEAEVKKRDGCCQKCGKTSQLVVHHLWYEGDMPWQTPKKGLITLCRDCHDSLESFKYKARSLGQLLLIAGLPAAHLQAEDTRLRKKIKGQNNAQKVH